jgi:hypothetical protein
VFLRSLQTLAHETYGQSFLQELFIKKYIKIFFKSFTFSINIDRVCFFINFYVCSETNIIRCLVTNQIVFYIAEPIKKLSLKYSFCEAVFTCFF